MATTWVPLTFHEFNTSQWITTTGRRVAVPPLEQTLTGIKIRVAGNATMSTYTKNFTDWVPTMMREWVRAQHGEELWLRVPSAERLRNASLRAANIASSDGATDAEFTPDPATLHLTRKATRNAATTAWWRFRHAELPITALVIVRLAETYTYNNPSPLKPQELSVTLSMQRLDPQTAHIARQSKTYDEWNHHIPSLMFGSVAAAEAAADMDRLAHRTVGMRSEKFSDQQAAVVAFAQEAARISSLTSIEVPITRSENAALEWLSLEQVESNVGDDFYTSLGDFCDYEPVVNEITALYAQMQEKFRTLGVVLAPKGRDEFLHALLGNYRDGTDIALWQPVAGQAGASHKVHVDLTSGALAVECVRPFDVDHDDIAQEWRAAKLVASMTGEEPELLAYARSYAASEAAKDAARHLSARRGVADAIKTARQGA